MVYELQKMTRARVRIDETDGLLKYTQGKLYDLGEVTKWLGEHRLLMLISNLFAYLFHTRGKVEHPHHRLFGAAADQGPDMLLASVKYLAFVLVTGSTILLLCIVIPDAIYLMHEGYNPVVTTEFVFFSFCTTLFAAV